MDQIFLPWVKNATKKEKTCGKRVSLKRILSKNTELGTNLTASTAVDKLLIWTSSIVGANGDM